VETGCFFYHGRMRPPLDVILSEIYTAPSYLHSLRSISILFCHKLFIFLAFPTRMFYVFLKFLFSFIRGLKALSVAQKL